MHALVFGVGPDLYAVPTASTREVVARPDVTAVPTAPPTVVGVFNLRGEIVPVFATATLLAQAPTDDAPPLVVVVETALGLAALAASTVREAVVLGDPVGETDVPGTAGAFAVDRSVAVLLDLDVLLSPGTIAA